jgi:O-antigen ligase
MQKMTGWGETVGKSIGRVTSVRDYLTPLLHFQRFFLPGLFAILAWAVWRTVIRRDIAVGLVLYLGLVIIVDGFLNTGIYLPGVEKGSIRYSELCAVFLFINRPLGPPNHVLRRIVVFLVGVYFALLFLSALRSDPMISGIFEFRRFIIPQIVAFLVAMRGLRSPNAYRRFFLFLTTLVIVIGLFTFWDAFFDRWLLRSDTFDHPMYYHNRELGRFGSFFLNPNYLGGFTVLVLPTVFIWTLNERQPWLRRYGWLGLLALVFCLVETQSRGPLLAFGIALLPLIFGPCGSISVKRRLGFLALFLMVFGLFMPGFYQHAVERFSSMDQETTTEHRSRQTLWLCTIRVISDHPVGGIGFGEKKYIEVTNAYGYDAMDNPHNSYLQIAVYAGIPALAAFLLANAVLLVKGARNSIGAPRIEISLQSSA